ncbi:MAG: winged helix-turn-helix transcriptional regulator [Asgard group archaeon]|nr:winged helix-turn-helix transcriptional regulator [Asgard group archaeon]
MNDESPKKIKSNIKIVAIPKEQAETFEKITKIKVVCCTAEEWTSHLSEIEGYEEVEQISNILKVIANPIRLKILLILMEREWACNCEFEVAFGEHQTLISHHLRNLRQAGLITSSKKGQWKFYKIHEEARAFLESIRKVINKVPLIKE